MYSVDEALEQLLAQPARRPEVERISIDRADGRITAEPVIATVSAPPADNSAMDGYAVRCADVRQTPSVLPLSMRLAAGDARGSLMAGTACRTFTGAELPDGADAVVIQEHCVPGPDSTVIINTRPQPGDHIRTRGQDFAAGSTVVAAGFRLRPQEIGLIASAGHETVSVYRRLRVAVITTGDELVEPGNPLERGQIYNSNRFLISALLRRFGAEVTARPPVRDDADATRQALGEAARDSPAVAESGEST